MSAPCWTLIGVLPLAFAAWLVQHPYRGVVHDGILYAFQAMQGMHPAFQGDLFLKYGSQDQYTLFNPIYGASISSLGLEVSSMVFVALGTVAWITGAIVLLRRLIGDGWPLAFLIVAAANPNYGFQYAEGFVTPRLFVEAMSLFAFRLMLDRKLICCFALLVLAALLHPVVALWGMAMVTMYLALTDWRWILLPVLGGVAGLGLGAIGLPPFDGLLQTFDDEWLQILEQRNRILFLSPRSETVWLLLASDVALLLAASLIWTGAARRVWLASLILVFLAVCGNYVFADVMGNVLGTQLQAWRATWVAHVLALAVVGGMAAQRAWTSQTGLAGIVALGACLCCIAAAATANEAAIHQVISSILLLIVIVLGFGQARLPGLRRLLRLVLAAGSIATALSALWVALLTFAAVQTYASFAAELSATIAPTTIVIPFAAILLGVLAGTRKTILMSCVGGIAGVAMFATAVQDFDRRSDWAVMVEQAEGSLPGFPVELAPEDSVLWQGDGYYSVPWLGLRQPSYLSSPQGAGLVFSRGTALEYARRSRIARPIDGAFDLDFRSGEPIRRLTPSSSDFGPVCAEAEPPALIVLIEPVEGVEGIVWNSPVPTAHYFETNHIGPATQLSDYGVHLSSRFYLYRCADLTG